MLGFETDKKYRRADVKELAGLPRDSKGGNWDTGIVEHENEFVIFANVGTAGRTGHDYSNWWEGEHFRWSHKRSSRLSWSSVQRLLEDGRRIHLFWRDSNSAPFEYAGLAKTIEVLDKTPVEILWSFEDGTLDETFFQGPDEVHLEEYREGTAHQVLVNIYERNAIARRVCINHYGTSCAFCGLNFEDIYGPTGAGYIHVHHLVPLSDCGEGYQVDPVKDLRPTCPNCHAMAHRRNPPFSVEEIQLMLKLTCSPNSEPA